MKDEGETARASATARASSNEIMGTTSAAEVLLPQPPRFGRRSSSGMRSAHASHGVVPDHLVGTMTPLVYQHSPVIVKRRAKLVDPDSSSSTVQEEEVLEITTLHDLIAGGLAGSASVFVGQPFDTIKVRMQASTVTAGSAIKPPFEFSAKSVRGLFSGMLPPFSMAGVVNALVFSSYGASTRLWDDYYANDNTNENANDNDTTAVNTHIPSAFWKNFLCGAAAGLPQTFVLCPTEHIKCRLQIASTSPHPPHYRGPLDVATHIYQTHGLSGLFRGFTATAVREIPAFGLYFSTYDCIKENIVSNVSDNPWMGSAFAGGVSGCLTWTVVYPIDVIKTKIQTSPLSNTVLPHERKMIPVAMDIVRQYGVKHLFRGLTVTLLRAFPVNGIIFPVYEFALLHLPRVV